MTPPIMETVFGFVALEGVDSGASELLSAVGVGSEAAVVDGRIDSSVGNDVGVVAVGVVAIGATTREETGVEEAGVEEACAEVGAVVADVALAGEVLVCEAVVCEGLDEELALSGDVL